MPRSGSWPGEAARPDGDGRVTRRRLLTIIESLRRGGAERLLVTIHRHLDRTRFEPAVVSLFGPNHLADELRALDVPVREMGFSGAGALLPGLSRLRRAVKELNPDLVHTHLYWANVSGRLAAVGRDAAVVTTLHNPDYTYEDPGTRRFVLKKWLDRKTGEWINDAFVAVSDEVRWDYERHMGFEEMETIPNFVDVADLRGRVDAVGRTDARSSLAIPPDAVVLLHVGRLHRQKGMEVVIEALSLVLKKVPEARLFLVGEGELRDSLERLARDEGVADQVSFEGSVADVAPYLAAADLFVFPSRWEAFGIALLEAMAAGLPSVVAPVGGITEVATEETSAMPLQRHPRVWAEAIVELIHDEERREAMGRAATERARAFDVRELLPRLEELYARL